MLYYVRSGALASHIQACRMKKSQPKATETIRQKARGKARKPAAKKSTVKISRAKKIAIAPPPVLLPMIAEIPQLIKKQVSKIFPKPLEFELMLALLLMVITEMSLLLMQ